jgi:hypothetical protein
MPVIRWTAVLPTIRKVDGYGVSVILTTSKTTDGVKNRI